MTRTRIVIHGPPGCSRQDGRQGRSTEGGDGWMDELGYWASLGATETRWRPSVRETAELGGQGSGA